MTTGTQINRFANPHNPSNTGSIGLFAISLLVDAQKSNNVTGAMDCSPRSFQYGSAIMKNTLTLTDPNTLAEKIEDTDAFAPKFDKGGLIPVVVTEVNTSRFLMLAYMNEEALRQSISSKQATYWSRSRKTLWRKGETSGNTQRIVEIRTDCDQDALQLIVDQLGPACHTDRKSCFYRAVNDDGTLVFRD